MTWELGVTSIISNYATDELLGHLQDELYLRWVGAQLTCPISTYCSLKVSNIPVLAGLHTTAQLEKTTTNRPHPPFP